MVETVIDRKPGDCKADLVEVCKEIKNQNGLGNLLKEWTITDEEITLKFE